MRQERNAVLFWTKKMREGVKAGMGGGGYVGEGEEMENKNKYGE